MTRLHGSIIVLTAALVSLSFPRAGHAQDRHGFWAGLGGGYGSVDVKCDGCAAQDREGGGAAYVRAGWTLSNRVLVGGEITIWTRERWDPAIAANRVVNLYNFSGTFTVYPLSASGFFVKAGAGASFVDNEIRGRGHAVTFDLGKGPGLLAGAGYDIRLGRQFSITPSFNFWYGRPGELRIMDETLVRGFRYNVLDFTVGLTFH